MKNYKGPGKTLNFIAPSGGAVSGSPYIVGAMFFVAITTEDEGDTVAGLVEGLAGLTKASGTTAAVGAAAYFDETSGLIETADSGTNRLLGAFAKAATSGNTNARVRLDGKAVGDGNSDLSAKADKIVPASVGNLAALNAAGNLTDSGVAPADKADSTFAAINALLAAASAAVDLNGQDVSGAEFAAALDTVQDELGIVGGVLTPLGTGKLLLITNEGATDDDLETIAMTNLSSAVGSKLMLFNIGGGDTTLKNGTGNIIPTISGGAGDFIVKAGQWVGLIWTGTAWDIDPGVVSGDVILSLLEAVLTPTQLAVLTAQVGVPFVIQTDISAAAAFVDVFDGDCPRKLQILDAWTHCTAANAGGTAKLNDAAGGGGTDITDAIIMAVDKVLTRAGTLDHAVSTVASGGDLSWVKNAEADDGVGYVLAVAIS